jgi:hypothetical protein
MALIQKTDPKGLDIKIDSFQSYMYNKLTALGVSDWQSYPRIYSVPTSANSNRFGLIPVHFVSGIDYDEVFMDDDFIITSYFYTDATETIDNWIPKTKVSWICQMNLDELFPSASHRFDEEFNVMVKDAAKNYTGYGTFTLTNIKKTIDEVYREFVTDQIKFTNMQPYYNVRFEFDVVVGC